MVLLKRTLVLMAVVSSVMAEPQRPGQNQYLPPDPKGYTYHPPTIEFITPTKPPTRPPFTPTPGTNTPYRPPFTPTPGTNTPYRPPFTPTPGTNTPYRPPFTPTPGTNTPYRPPFTPTPGTNTPYRPPFTPTTGTNTPYRPPFTPTPGTGITTPYRPPFTGTTPRPPPIDYTGDHSHHHEDHHGPGHVHEPGMPFDFSYAVKDDSYGTDYSHNAVSDGDVVKGEYRVQLPDGRMQIVRYNADWKTGFHADVSYEGQPRYPDTPGGNYGAPGGRRPGGY